MRSVNTSALSRRCPATSHGVHPSSEAYAGKWPIRTSRARWPGGSGAGHPAKLYRRAPGAVEVSLPERRYDLAGELLAGALEEADASGEPPRAVLSRRARARGRAMGVPAPGEA